MIELLHAPERIGAFSIKVGGEVMAAGHTRALIGYQNASGLRWVNLETVRAHISAENAGIAVQAEFLDLDGATWRLEQRFTHPRMPHVIEVQSRVSVDRDRTVVYLPMLTLLPGLGSFGKARGQALMPGLEHLDAQDVSSSEADITGPLSHRQVPDTMRLCFPLLAIHAGTRSIGLCWQPDSAFCPVFDTPDRLFASGAHLLGVLYPGCDGQNRLEGCLLPYRGEKLPANHALVLRAAILAGSGPDILPIVRRYVEYRGLPPLPQTPGLPAYAGLAAAGWLDSKVSEAGRFRHAYWPGTTGFAPQPAADAGMYMDWLAPRVADPRLKMRLE